MPNRSRPRCPGPHEGGANAMAPARRKGPKGEAFVKIPDTFHCAQHDVIARGRGPTRYLTASKPKE